MDTALHSSKVAVEAIGCTYRQLDYWDRIGLLRPTQPAHGSGSRRAYSPDELVAGRAITLLSAMGAAGPPLARAAQAVHGLIAMGLVDERVYIDREGAVSLEPPAEGIVWSLVLTAPEPPETEPEG